METFGPLYEESVVSSISYTRGTVSNVPPGQGAATSSGSTTVPIADNIKQKVRTNTKSMNTQTKLSGQKTVGALVG